MTRHLAHLALTEADTFIAFSLSYVGFVVGGVLSLRRDRLFESVGYSASCEVVGGEFYEDFVAGQYADEVQADFA